MTQSLKPADTNVADEGEAARGLSGVQGFYSIRQYFHIVSRFSSLFLTMIFKYFFKIPLDN